MKQRERIGRNMNNPYKNTYTLQEVSKRLNVPAGTIKRWEKDLHGFLVIPRMKQGARYFTELEIALLTKIKELRGQNMSFQKIAEILFKETDGKEDSVPIPGPSKQTEELAETKDEPLEEIETSVIPVSPPPAVKEQSESSSLEEFFKMMDAYKQNLIEELKSEIRNGVRKEVIDEVKKEIAKGSVHTVKSLSNSIYKLSENTKSEIKELSDLISETSENTNENILTLSHVITATSELTTETIDTLANQIAVTSENTDETLERLSNKIVKTAGQTSEMLEILSDKVTIATKTNADSLNALQATVAQTANATHHELSNLVDAINKDRELYIQTLHEERMHYNQEIRSREAVFQDLVASFRNAAAAKDQKNKKWWMFWK
jgi:DNA-binding transcriptional MerR regulator